MFFLLFKLVADTDKLEELDFAMAGTCHYVGCNTRRGLLNGYCRVHKWHANPPKSLANKNVKNEALNKQLGAMQTSIEGLQQESLELTNIVEAQAEEIRKLKADKEYLLKENGDLKQKVNKNFLATDGQNAYGRKDCGKVRNAPEAPQSGNKKADRIKDNEHAVKAVIETAEKMGVTIVKEDIQRCHRIGNYTEGKVRPVVVKFRWYKKRMDFLTNKKKLKPDTKNLNATERKELMKKSVFITEHLTPYRGKVFRFLRDYNNTKNVFDVVTTFDGMISIKRKLDDEKWVNVTSSLDFHDLGIPREEYEEEFDELLFLD